MRGTSVLTLLTEPARRGGRTIWVRFSDSHHNFETTTCDAIAADTEMALDVHVLNCIGAAPSPATDPVLGIASVIDAQTGKDATLALSSVDNEYAGQLHYKLLCEPSVRVAEEPAEQPPPFVLPAAVSAHDSADEDAYTEDTFESDNMGTPLARQTGQSHQSESLKQLMQVRVAPSLSCWRRSRHCVWLLHYNTVIEKQRALPCV